MNINLPCWLTNSLLEMGGFMVPQIVDKRGWDDHIDCRANRGSKGYFPAELLCFNIKDLVHRQLSKEQYVEHEVHQIQNIAQDRDEPLFRQHPHPVDEK
jgi:hypothetical protein